MIEIVGAMVTIALFTIFTVWVYFNQDDLKEEGDDDEL